jgi:hypothetical protein
MKSISRMVLAFATLASIIVFSTKSVAQTQKKFTVKNLPEAVSSAFKKSYPNAVIKGADKEVENGKTFYEIESIDGTLKRDLLYTPEGNAFEIEETIAASTLPDAVKQAISKEYPKGKIDKVEKNTREGTIQYDVTVKSGRKVLDASISPDGKIMSKKEVKMKKEAKEAEEKEENEENDKD